ncbi:translocase of chloroplast 120, chloroplastic-like protein, partial [Tanacetum coccineum]
ENNEGSKGILEDVPEVNKKAAHVIIENSENGVSSDADLDETVIHIRVNGDSVDHGTQPDGEISGEVNGDQLHEDVNGKDALVTDDNDDESVKQNDKVESTTNDLLNVQNEHKVEQNEEVVLKRFKPSSSAIHEPEVERQPSFDDKVSESVADSSKIREQKDEDKPLNKEPESRPVIGLVEQLRGRTGGRVAAFSFERASAMAEQLEAAGQEPLEFSCTIMVLGKTGVGKSATINSIFDEVKFRTDAFQLGTKKVQDVVGTVQGIKVRVIDTPGLLPFWADQRKNQKNLQSVKKFIQKSPPDIVLYLDRLDMQSRDDMPLLRTITDIFGQSIWFNAIVVLTHAASAPPEGPNGTATSYDIFVTQRSHVVQQAIRQAAGDMRLMNPVSLVENHSACRTNRNGQRVLPNGQVWKPHLLLLSFASKILVEANMLLKLQDSPPGKLFAARSRAPPLPYILSTLLQSRPQLKLPQEQFGDDNDDALDDDIDESSDEETSEYDELPPFKRLTNAQVSKLSKEQKKSYYDELEYREKLFMKKQLKEETKEDDEENGRSSKDFPN